MGMKFFKGENIWDSHGPRGPAMLQPLAAASTIAPMRQSTSGQQLCAGNRQTNDLICIISIQKDSTITSPCLAAGA